MRVCSGSSDGESNATRTKPRQTCTTLGQSSTRAKCCSCVLIQNQEQLARSVIHGMGTTVFLKADKDVDRQTLHSWWSCFHNRCFLPVAVALAFRDTPGLVAPAVHAFCSGDPADKKMGVRMTRLITVPASVAGVKAAGSASSGSQPEAPLFVEARIAFTRYLYAQLHQAAFVPAKAFPPG